MPSQNIKFTPKWIIFSLDLFCCIASLIFAFYLRFNFQLITIHANFHIFDVTMVAAVVSACILITFKTYAGLIRFTTMEDMSRILQVNVIITAILLVIQQLYPRNIETGYSFIPISVLAIAFVCNNFAMIFYRIIVRKIFELYLAPRKKKTKAIMYGGGYEGILAKKMFNENQRSAIKIVGVIEDNEKYVGKIIDNGTINKANRSIIEKYSKEGVELLIVADPFLKRERLNELVDICLELGIKAQMVPPSEKWINDQLDAKQLKNINIEELLERDVISIKNEKVAFEIKGKTVLVTGAAGSIGSEITRILTTYEPALIIACDNAETPLHSLRLSLGDNDNVKIHIGDITNKARMEQIFETYAPDFVYHAAAYKHVPIMEDNPTIAIINNVFGTKLLADLSVTYGVEKFVMVSTDKAVNPTNVMGASKRIAEIYCQSLNNFNKVETSEIGDTLNKKMRSTRFITTRFGNVLGSNGSVIPLFKQQLENGGPLTITHPDITRYFMTIPEACQLVIEAGSMGKGGEIFVFDMGKPVKIVDLARKMISLSGKIPDVDVKITFTGLRQGEKLYEELLNNEENTMPTYHQKILIANVRTYDFQMVVNQINELVKLANLHLNMETVGKMKELVPEFISNNSIYQSLDKKVEQEDKV